MPRPLLITILALAPIYAGCVAAAAAGVVGVGLFQYQRNEAEQDFPSALPETWSAVLEGLKGLAIEPETSALGATEGRLTFQDMVVLVERHPEGFTRVRVRVGAFHTADHERRARLVLQEIAASIGRQDDLRAWSEKVQGLSQPPAQPAPQPKPRN